MVSHPTPHSVSKQGILAYLRKYGQANAQTLAQHLDITPQAIRRHLKDLEQEELVICQSVSGHMGRPQHRYQLSSLGEEQFPASYDEFAIGLLTALAQTVGPEQMGSILQKQWQAKAKDYRQQLGDKPLPERLAVLVDLRRAEGYMADYYPYDPEKQDPERQDPEKPEAEKPEAEKQYVLTEYNCAISQVASSFPSVCHYELEMFAEILPDCRVERINWQREGEHHCGYLISVNLSKVSQQFSYRIAKLLRQDLESGGGGS